MKRFKLQKNVIFIILTCFVLLISLYVVFMPSNAALRIESTPEALVYIDEEQVGKTPLEIERAKRSVNIRLIPENFSEALTPYETTLSLTEGVKTIVRHSFSENEFAQETHIISFEKTGASSAEIAVVSNPDGARVSYNGRAQGVTPLRFSIDDTTQSLLSLEANGYTTSQIMISPQNGFLLTAFVNMAAGASDMTSTLSKLTEETPEEIVEEKKVETLRVQIVNTPTGFLRVRQNADISSPEVYRVEPGQEYEIAQSELVNGFYEIIIDATRSGFISAEYATMSATLTP